MPIFVIFCHFLVPVSGHPPPLPAPCVQASHPCDGLCAQESARYMPQ